MASNKPPQRAPLMSLDEALGQVLAQARVLAETESVAILDADGRFLAEDLISGLQVPPQDNSSMDGYAVRVEDLPVVGVKLKVTQRIPAGQSGHALLAGEAARIFTGAPIPRRKRGGDARGYASTRFRKPASRPCGGASQRAAVARPMDPAQW